MGPDEPLFHAIAARLGGRLRGHAPLAGGVSARVEAVDLLLPDGSVRRVVFREPRAAAWNQAGPDLARREHDLLGWLHARGLPVPRPLLVDGTCAVHPRPFLVMERIDGGAEVADVSAAILQMAELLATLHGLDLNGLPALPEREDPVAGLLELLPEGYEDLRARLLADPPRLAARRTLLHGDYWPGNVLWREGRLVGLIDWEDAALGDPLSDLACCRLELRYKHGPQAAADFLSRYAALTRRDLTELAIWEAYVAAAATRYMGHWGLEPALEAHMRREAEQVLRAAADLL